MGADNRTYVEYWNDGAAGYVAGLDGPYHRHRLAVLDALMPPAPVVVLDFGCGDGVMLERAAIAGAAVLVGVDVSEIMLDAARERVPGAALHWGGVDHLANLYGTFDLIVAANVLAYLDGGDVERFYAHARRLLEPGGHLVVTHSNELFDLFTLNGYTVDFHRRHFGVDVAELLTHPEPASTFPTRANPLTYPDELAAEGFQVERLEYVRHHPAPPPLLPGHTDLDANEYADTLAVAPADRWKLAFTCSMFGVRARKL